MSQSASVFNLDVQLVEKSCLFKLSWGQGQKLSATLPYPEMLDRLYQEWRADYLCFYNTALRGTVAEDSTSSAFPIVCHPALRGKVVDNGTIAPPPVDWHARLVQSEAKLLYEFHQWLRRGELFDIRSRIIQAAGDEKTCIEVFLTCNPLDLARLPWEAWEIGTESAGVGKIRFFRIPPDVVEPPVTPHNCKRQARILVILGDDTGLNFEAERKALQSLSQSKIADIQFVGWQPGKDTVKLKAEIIDAIADPQGWDVLLFAGHSNEKELVGGELMIAPGASFFLKEIEQPLLLAKERGLQFALFNSCKGLDIANALISLGLSQVAVMREPIHNQVAEEFLVRFLQRLGEYNDVYESLQYACEYLKLGKHLTYPSAYLIPSLFRHPNAPLFCLKPSDLWIQIKRWLPTKREAIALAVLGLVSWQLSVQNFLLEKRVLTQAVYRQVTNQVQTVAKPPVLLLAIDEQSIRKERKISNLSQLDRKYIARLVDKLSDLNARAIGIDYLLDFPQENSDSILAQSIQAARQKQGTWFVLVANRDNAKRWVGVIPEIVNLTESLQGNMNLLHWQNKPNYMMLVPKKDSSSRNLPFAYLLALAERLNVQPIAQLPPSQGSFEEVAMASPQQGDFLSQVIAYLHRITGQDYTSVFSKRSRLNPITNFSYVLNQMWLHPIIDFSIPPEQVYQSLPAWQFLETPANSPQLRNLEQQVVIIAPGGYSDKLGDPLQGDNFLLPASVSYWRTQQVPPDPRQIFTGGEIHAYMLHHFLNQRLVIPIPDLWAIGLVALLGKGTALALEQQRYSQQRRQWYLMLIGATAAYGLISLQLYISAALLLPWLLPSMTFWTYALPHFLRRKTDA